MTKLRPLLVGLAALIVCGQAFSQPPLDKTQYLQAVSRQQGWAGERIAEAASRDAPRFQLHAKQDNANRRVCLWDCVLWVTGGEHLPTRRQAIGDCVGFGAAQAVDYLQFVRIVLYGKEETYKPVFVPYHYACGRNAPECGAGQIRGPDGSIGAWQAKALQLYGVIAADTPGLPGYSADVARRWAVRMPDQAFIQEGKRHLVKTIALVETPEQARDSICNGYPLTIASSWGGLMEPPVVDGKLVNRRATQWMHQMCIIAYDGAGKEPLWYVLNSWGPDAHGRPPDNSPAGGFWIRQADLEFILRQKDVWALSDLETGFEPRDLDVSGLTHRTRFGGKTDATCPPDPLAGDRPRLSDRRDAPLSRTSNSGPTLRVHVQHAGGARDWQTAVRGRTVLFTAPQRAEVH